MCAVKCCRFSCTIIDIYLQLWCHGLSRGEGLFLTRGRHLSVKFQLFEAFCTTSNDTPVNAAAHGQMRHLELSHRWRVMLTKRCEAREDENKHQVAWRWRFWKGWKNETTVTFSLLVERKMREKAPFRIYVLARICPFLVAQHCCDENFFLVTSWLAPNVVFYSEPLCF